MDLISERRLACAVVGAAVDDLSVCPLADSAAWFLCRELWRGDSSLPWGRLIADAMSRQSIQALVRKRLRALRASHGRPGQPPCRRAHPVPVVSEAAGLDPQTGYVDHYRHLADDARRARRRATIRAEVQERVRVLVEATWGSRGDSLSHRPLPSPLPARWTAAT